MIYCSDNKILMDYINTSSFLAQKYAVNKDDTNATCFQVNDYIIVDNEKVYDTKQERKLLGKHNLTNIMVCLTISKILKLNMAKAAETVATFEPLEYRLQNIGTVDNITYYTDTLATIPEATIEAIDTIPNVNTLIFGGMDRGINYDKLIEYLKTCQVTNFICMPTTGHDIGHTIGEIPGKNFYYVETLEEAVNLAKQVTKPNTCCLLSPAASSYAYFKNYADKGDKYKEFVYSKK
jgi:UDP-N-acetylmuramoylalanine--D-glutamate ligase